ncbi:Chromosomal replication initiator protein DnaA [Dissulfuribacter thermophilus]|uniref:Chromosomal replication initiator protein DnaA n=1 Tax=Dissulfuribacter thermophilus TaxID=1156395 RepID=A0A1B9F5S7_9BACT|nr:chromosomal replication initiator protein DnaA [Dissulfuribacter thermophilus]OCC15289.1 Chromosomal replication initiator protein DnaA [Dissulfuribacter thermophilus]
MNRAEEAWIVLKEKLSQKISEGSYRIWIQPLTFDSFEDNTLYLKCPNQFSASWIREHYLPLIQDEIRKELGDCSIKLIPVERVKDAKKRQLHLPTFSPTELPQPRFCQWFTFEEFVVGESNQYAYEVCKNVAYGGSKRTGEVVFLQADSGLGKSHLAQAVGQYVYKRAPQKRLCYINANDFTHQVVRALKDGNLEDLKERYRRKVDVLLLEEVHSFSGRKRTQAELANTLDYLLDSGKLVVFTSSRLPREIPKLDSQLRSRLDLGIITSINPPDYETRVKIIERKARRHGVSLDRGVVEYMAHYLRGDIRRIEGAVVGLITKSSIQKRPMDLNLAQEVLQEMMGDLEPLNLKKIISLVVRHFNVSVEELRSSSRKKSVTVPRQIAMYLARTYTDETLNVIGKEFKRDHATVVHAVKKIEKGLKMNSKIKHQVEFLKEQLEKERWRK